MECLHSVPLFLEGIHRTCLPVFVPIRNPIRGRPDFLFLSEVKTVTASDIKRLFQHVIDTTLRFVCNPNDKQFAEDMIHVYGELLLEQVLHGPGGTLANLFLEHCLYWSTQTTRCMFLVESVFDLKYVCTHNVLCAYLHLLLNSTPERAPLLASKARDTCIKCAVALFETKSKTLRQMCAPLLSDIVYESVCPLFVECVGLFRTYVDPWAAKQREMSLLNVKITVQTSAWSKTIELADSDIDIARAWILMPMMAFLHDFQATTYMCRVVDLASANLAEMQTAEDPEQKMGLLDFLLGLRHHAKERIDKLSMNAVLERCERSPMFNERQSKFIDVLDRIYKMPTPDPDRLDEIYGTGIVPARLIERTKGTKKEKKECKLNVLTTHFDSILKEYRLPLAWMYGKVASFRTTIVKLEQLTSENIVTDRGMEFSRNMSKYLVPE